MRLKRVAIILNGAGSTGFSTLSWTDVSALIGYAPVSYTLYRGTLRWGPHTAIYVGPNTSYVDTPLGGSVTYYYYVIARYTHIRVTSNVLKVVIHSELGEWTTWGQNDIYPFNYPSGASSTKTFAQLT